MATLRSRRAATAEPEAAAANEGGTYRWTTSVMVTGPQISAAAYDFGRELATIMAEHGHDLQYGADVVGQLVHWHVDCGSLAEIQELKAGLLDSEDYRNLFDENTENWVPNSFRETLVEYFDVTPATE